MAQLNTLSVWTEELMCSDCYATDRLCRREVIGHDLWLKYLEKFHFIPVLELVSLVMRSELCCGGLVPFKQTVIAAVAYS